MRNVRYIFLSSFFIRVCFCALSRAQMVGQIMDIELLTTEVGWAATNQQLFSTNGNWRPPE